MSGISEINDEFTRFLNGSVDGNVVSFTTDASVGVEMRPHDGSTTYRGILEGNTIQGELEGSGIVYTINLGEPPITVTWSGTFTVTIQK